VLRVRGVRSMPPPDAVDANFLQYNSMMVREIGTPSSGVITSATSLALFYQELLGNRHGPWSRRVLADATQTVRNHFEVQGLKVSANRTIGLLVAGEEGTHFRHLFGDGPSARAFGHTGAAGQVSFADPETDISFAFLTHALDADPLRQREAQRRMCDLVSALADAWQ
jgi:CubicO group peptidase (beta-lactamase class C family)